MEKELKEANLLQNTSTNIFNLEKDYSKYNCLENKYFLISSLGSGSSCKVKLAICKDTKKKVAIKILKPHHNSASSDYSSKGTDEPTEPNNSNESAILAQSESKMLFFRETQVLKQLSRHKNIINVLDSKADGVLYKNRKNYLLNIKQKRLLDSDKSLKLDPIGAPSKSKASYIVLEYASNLELFDYISYCQCGFAEEFAKVIFYEILEGIEYIHNSGFCHRDLKTENIFFDENFNIKIGDFGFAAKALNLNPAEDIYQSSDYKLDLNENNVPSIATKDSSSSILRLKSKLGTPTYMAPEIIIANYYNGIKADIFSLGVILFVINFGRIPFEFASIKDNLYRIIAHKDYERFWVLYSAELQNYNLISTELKTLFNKLVSFDLIERPSSIGEIKADPWFSSLKDSKNLGISGNKRLIEELKARKQAILNQKLTNYDPFSEYRFIHPMDARGRNIFEMYFKVFNNFEYDFMNDFLHGFDNDHEELQIIRSNNKIIFAQKEDIIYDYYNWEIDDLNPFKFEMKIKINVRNYWINSLAQYLLKLSYKGCFPHVTKKECFAMLKIKYDISSRASAFALKDDNHEEANDDIKTLLETAEEVSNELVFEVEFKEKLIEQKNCTIAVLFDFKKGNKNLFYIIFHMIFKKYIFEKIYKLSK